MRLVLDVVNTEQAVAGAGEEGVDESRVRFRHSYHVVEDREPVDARPTGPGVCASTEVWKAAVLAVVAQLEPAPAADGHERVELVATDGSVPGWLESNDDVSLS